MTRIITIVLMLAANTVFACGNVSQQFQAYWAKDNQKDKAEFLSNSNNSSPINYSPTRDDQQIVLVLVDAIDSGIQESTIIKALKNHQCAASESNSKNYQYLTEQLGDDLYEKYCPQSYIERIYQINANRGVNLRDQPNKNGRVIGTIANGNAVELIARADEWLKVNSDSGIGYVYAPLVFKP